MKQVESSSWAIFTGLLAWFFLLPVTSFAQGGCGDIVFNFAHYEPCKYRLEVDNTSECYPFLRLLLDEGEFESWTADTQNGWIGELITPSELLLTHNGGFVPLGASAPVELSLPAELNLVVTILWDYNCDLGEGCAAEFPLMACTLPADACISGVKYWECEGLPYANQAPLPSCEMILANEQGQILATTLTDDIGEYFFCDLAAGEYQVASIGQPGWSPSIPVSGQSIITLTSSAQEVLNFGFCPDCSCESLYLDAIGMTGQLNDTCAYTIVVQNLAEDCFDAIHITLESGEITSWMFFEAGWEVELLDAQHLRLLSTSGPIPVGGHYPLKLNVTGSEEVIITMSASEVGSGLPGLCERSAIHPCPLPATASCCPAGTFRGPELTTNGDFEAGNTGFVTGFPYFTPGFLTVIGRYSVLQSNQVYAANTQWACTDHTAASPTGRMLIVDGAYAPSNLAWRNYVPVQQGKQYSFCAFVNNIIRPPRDLDNPIIQLWINFSQVAIINLNETPDAWVPLTTVWTANTNGSVPIDIRLGSPVRVGNDFAVDDISFRECSPIPFCEAEFSFQLNSPCGNVQFTNLSTPTTGLTYCWDFDGDLTTCESTAQNPNWTYPGCGTHPACLTITGPECPGTTVCQQLTITDQSPPTATCLLNPTVLLDANCSASIVPTDVAVNFLDNCQISSVSVSPNTFSDCGTEGVTLTLTDWCNNITFLACQVQVVDHIPPAIVCPPTFSTNCNANILPGLTGVATATDNCSSAVQISFSYTDVVFSQMNPITGALCDDKVERSWTAADHCGNISTCIQTIAVHDNIDPILTNCPISMTVLGTLDTSGLCSASLSLITPTVSDNCDPFPSLTNSFNGTADASGTYPSGSTTVNWTAMDACGNVDICSFTVTVACNPLDTCRCGTFSDLFLRGPQGAQSQPLVCGGPPLNLGCPAPGIGFTLSGYFECDGSDCPPSADIDWILLAPDGGQAATGTTQSPWFALTLASANFSQSGIYTLVLNGHCGGEICPCVLEFLVEEGCPELCPCDTEALQAHVDQGFASLFSGNSCRACFSPLALDDCDEVEWLIDDLLGTAVGTSKGNQSFCYTFPAGGSYTIYMRVTRQRSDGTLCESSPKAQTVTVSCLFRPACDNTVWGNPGFSLGAVAGSLGNGGESAGWMRVWGDPHINHSSSGSYDGWTVLLSGNADTSDVLSRVDPICLDKTTGVLNLRLAGEPIPGAAEIPLGRGRPRLVIELHQEGDFVLGECQSMSCFSLSTIDLSEIDTGWFDLEIPFDLSEWPPIDPCGGVEVRPLIYVTNDFGENQGGEQNRFRLNIDHLCLDGLVDTEETLPNSGIRLFPNPTSEILHLHFAAGVPRASQLQIRDLWGRVLYSDALIVGALEYSCLVDKLPSGIYLVQVLVAGRPIWMEKVVKG